MAEGFRQGDSWQRRVLLRAWLDHGGILRETRRPQYSQAAENHSMKSWSFLCPFLFRLPLTTSSRPCGTRKGLPGGRQRSAALRKRHCVPQGESRATAPSAAQPPRGSSIGQLPLSQAPLPIMELGKTRHGSGDAGGQVAGKRSLAAPAQPGPGLSRANRNPGSSPFSPAPPQIPFLNGLSSESPKGSRLCHGSSISWQKSEQR